MNDKAKTPLTLISDGYRATEAANAARRRREVASRFERDDRMERLLTMKQRDPTTFAKLDVTTHMAVGMYLQTKAAFEQENDHGDDAA